MLYDKILQYYKLTEVYRNIKYHSIRPVFVFNCIAFKEKAVHSN